MRALVNLPPGDALYALSWLGDGNCSPNLLERYWDRFGVRGMCSHCFRVVPTHSSVKLGGQSPDPLLTCGAKPRNV